MGSSDVEKNFDERDADRDEKPDLHRHEEDTEESSQSSKEVELVNLPNDPCGFEVDQGQDCRDDNCREDGIGRVFKQRGEKQERDEHRNGHNHISHGCLHSRLVIHG